jgi:hypothetical protein
MALLHIEAPATANGLAERRKFSENLSQLELGIDERCSGVGAGTAPRERAAGRADAREERREARSRK